MRDGSFILFAGGPVAGAFLLATAAAGELEPWRAEASRPPVVVELFGSQSCSSCPPASDALAEIAARPDVVALYWHVDYWNNLPAGSAGRWRDPFSHPSHTNRQTAYNVRIRRRSTVYTPQVVVDGVAEAVGSRRSEVTALIEAERPRPVPPPRIMARLVDGAPDFRIYDAPPGTEALLVSFMRTATTDVPAGENKGRSLPEVNNVMSVRNFVHNATVPWTIAAPAPAKGYGCALLIQEANAGPILAGAYCPSPAGPDAAP